MEKYKDLVLSEVPRILGFGDRESSSPTFGCFDRNFWHYKIVDFPSAWFQMVCLLLAYLFRYQFPQNEYYGNKKILDWAKASIDFWFSSLNRDGSASEVFPYERSFCCTAFCLYDATEAAIILGTALPKELQKSALWLCKHNRFDLANQMAASILALHNVYILTEEDRFKEARDEKLSHLLDSQHSSGYFSEYGGYDIGYMSLTIGFLSKYCKKTNDQSVLQAVKKAESFLEGKIDLEGSFDSRETARRTQYLYPYGFAFLKSDLLKRHMKGIELNRIINPGWLDDRYVIPLAIDYLETYLELSK